MSIEKKSLISNRTTIKKANVAKASAVKISSTKLVKPLLYTKATPQRVVPTMLKK